MLSSLSKQAYNKQEDMADLPLAAGIVCVAELDDRGLLDAVEAVIARDEALDEYVEAVAVRERPRPVTIPNYVELIVPAYSDLVFKSHFRMQRTTVEDLCHMLSPYLLDRVITIEKKILATLWMLGNLETFRSVSDRFGLSKSSLHDVVMEVCNGLKLVQDNILSFPQPNQFQALADDFPDKSGIMGIIGAVDGTLIEIPGPKDFRESYVCRKGYPSIQLQAVCDSNLRFLDINVGRPGSLHDQRVFKKSPLYTALQNGYFPENFHLLGDSAYTLETYMLVPYRDNGHLTDVQKTFNARHSSARAVIERAFGLLKGKFQRLKYLNMTSIDKIPLVVSAACIIHNYILLKERLDDQDFEYQDIEEMPPMPDPEALQPAQAAQRKRDQIAHSLA